MSKFNHFIHISVNIFGVYIMTMDCKISRNTRGFSP